MFGYSRNIKALSINMIVFGAIGIIYYAMFAMQKLEEALFHPLAYGWIGIWFSIVGGLSAIQYFKCREITLYKNSIYAIFYSVVYFLGFFFVLLFVSEEHIEIVQMLWLGLLLVSYFVTFGMLNWYFGFYIALFNICIAVLALVNGIGGEISPVVWVSLFSFSGISNIYVQWGIVILSTILGLLEKGFSMFDILE